VAVVVPSEVKIDDLLEKYMNMEPIEDLDALLDAVVGRERISRDVAIEAAFSSNRGVGLREYDIIQ
jgi:hypothetical protein